MTASGADLSTVTTVNDIRNLGFILCAGLVGSSPVCRLAAG